MTPARQTIAGRYELWDELGQGGMGVVYRGRDAVLDRIVAVKVLPAAYAMDATLVERFEREARAVARLSHPNIVSIFDTGHDGTVHYIVMECVPGESLAQRLRTRGALDVPEAVGIGAQVADALAAAHAAGIVHRDVKPGNVMVEPSGTCKVLDFGIARAAAEAALTQDAAMLGSAPYMSPETALGRTADARSDIYSLGCVLYQMLTGRLPFSGEVPAAVISQHVSVAPQRPIELQPGIPAALDALVMQMLAKDPSLRPQDAGAAAAALRASLRSPAPVRPVPRQDLAPPPRPENRSPLGLIVVATLVALLVGIGVALAASSGGKNTATSSTTAGTTSATRTSHSSTQNSPTQSSPTQSSPTTTSTRTSSTTTPTTSTSTTTKTSTPSSSSTTSRSSVTSASASTPTTTP